MVSPAGKTVGPFPWTLVRGWFALGLIPENAWACVAGEEVWQGLYEFPEVCPLEGTTIKQDSSVTHYISTDRFRKPSTTKQHAYLQTLDCPFTTENLDWHLTSWITGQLSTLFPEKCNSAIEREIDEDSQDPNFWHSEPATAKQISYLESRGISLRADATKGEAAALIDPASEGQVRRLKFYGTRLPQYLTKRYASTLINMHIRKHPESEAKYQQWKLDNGI